MAKSLMIQGTCSNAGKSLLVTALCRIYRNRGYSVAPFKAQNMALNSFVTRDGLEMGRAQVTQSQACGKEPDVRMNPVLLKPSSDTGSQVIVMGKARGTMDFRSYRKKREEYRSVIAGAYHSLAAENDIIILEGAGSPAEVNLKQNDLVNMGAAFMASSPVLIAGDIDRGGVFASLLGTHQILTRRERRITKGFLINKFRGDASLLSPAFEFLKKKTGKDVLGVIPHIPGLRIPDEDSVDFKQAVGRGRASSNKEVNVAVIDLPHISNFTDFDPFLEDEDVHLYTISRPEEAVGADVLILPGSKNVIGDWMHLKKTGMDQMLEKASREGVHIIGICGGYQMLGRVIEDPYQLESRDKKVEGLGFLDMETRLEQEKSLSQTRARCGEYDLNGYEIHHGISRSSDEPYVTAENGEVIGTRRDHIRGTYLHGIFDNALYRRSFLNEVRGSKSLPPLEMRSLYSLDGEIQRLADAVEASVDMDRIDRIIGL